MQLSLCPQPLYDRPLPAALDAVVGLGLRALELPVDGGSPLVDLERLLAGGARALRAELEARGLALSALSNHQEGQLLLGPHHADTDPVHPGSPEEKRTFARARLLRSAELASELEVGTLIAFLGCEDWSRWFPWPAEDGWERMLPRLQEELVPLLERFDALGVDLALEPHPKQMVYDVDSAQACLRLVEDHRRLRFNLDPANLVLVGVDPVVFVAELGARIAHVHAKDGERVAHNAGRSGPCAAGPWDAPGRGFRFRIPGWGDVPWKRLVSELIVQGYGGYLAIENEDPLFAPLDGIEKAQQFLDPLLPRGERRERWW